jgi:acetyl-CoA acyltransferase
LVCPFCLSRFDLLFCAKPPNNKKEICIREAAGPEAVIVSAVRTPVGRAFKGSLRSTRPDDLAALAIKEALARVPAVDAKEIDDVILGCAMPEGEQGMNVARIASLRAGLPIETSAMTINRFCSSGLQAIALAAERIRSGSAEIIVAGGTESMSMVPMGGNKVAPNPWLVDHKPDTYINMGLGTENIARKFGISREQADQFAADSHKKAIAAIAALLDEGSTRSSSAGELTGLIGSRSRLEGWRICAPNSQPVSFAR